MVYVTSAYSLLGRLIIWPHLTPREIGKCSLAGCPGGKRTASQSLLHIINPNSTSKKKVGDQTKVISLLLGYIKATTKTTLFTSNPPEIFYEMKSDLQKQKLQKIMQQELRGMFHVINHSVSSQPSFIRF